MTVKLAVTVSSSGGGTLHRDARAAAERWQLPFFERKRNTGLEHEMGAFADAFLVLGGDGWTLRDPTVTLRFTPGMAALRIKRIEAGYTLDDHLVKLTELKAGDSVIDGTMGLGADALVCAHVVGPSGHVLGIESSLPIYALVSEGIKPLKISLEARLGDTHAVLESLPSASVDVVVLDPMFDQPKKSSPHFELLRKFADHRPLELGTLNEARRVSKRWVVVKAGRYTQEFVRLGLTPSYTSRFKSTVWARVGPL